MRPSEGQKNQNKNSLQTLSPLSNGHPSQTPPFHPQFKKKWLCPSSKIQQFHQIGYCTAQKAQNNME